MNILGSAEVQSEGVVDSWGEDVELLEQPHAPHVGAGYWIVAAVLMCVGLLSQALVWDSALPIVGGLLFFAVGLLILAIPGMSTPLSRRAFVLAFAALIFVAGLNQLYQAYLYQGTRYLGILWSDETMYYDVSRVGLSGGSVKDYKVSVFVVPFITWRIVYDVARMIGLGNGPWIGVMTNGLITALCSNVLVLTARHIFGDDDRKLRFVGTVFCFMGVFWMLGAIFVRDCFALALNLLVFHAIVRWLSATNTKSTILAAVALVVCGYGMHFVRQGATPLFILYPFLAMFAFAVGRKALGVWMIGLILGGVVILIAVGSLIGEYVGGVFEYMSALGGGYRALTVYEVVEGESLANKFVIQQPLPVRLFTGPPFLLFAPLPVGAAFRLHEAGYRWIVGFHSIASILLFPLMLLGAKEALSITAGGGRKAAGAFFSLMVAGIGMIGIVATSLKVRHLGQFFPMFILLMALPDLSQPSNRNKLVTISVIWFALVFLAHVLWFALKVG